MDIDAFRWDWLKRVMGSGGPENSPVRAFVRSCKLRPGSFGCLAERPMEVGTAVRECVLS